MLVVNSILDVDDSQVRFLVGPFLEMKTEIISIFKKEEEIKKIVDKVRSYSFEELDKHFHFEFSLIEKLTDSELISETFGKFDLIGPIELRENEKKQRYYSFNYVLDDGTYLVISIVLDRVKPFVINAFYAKRNYEGFEKSLRKNYGDRFV